MLVPNGGKENETTNIRPTAKKKAPTKNYDNVQDGNERSAKIPPENSG
jgi:hypothetical protein